jgi:hypothetical protein
MISMHLSRSLQAPFRPSFGRRALFVLEEPATAPAFRISDDLKLFAVTFLGGFVFVSILLA